MKKVFPEIYSQSGEKEHLFSFPLTTDQMKKLEEGKAITINLCGEQDLFVLKLKEKEKK